MNTYPPPPAKSPFHLGARVQLHGYSGYPAGPWRTGWRGAVVGGLGTNALWVRDDAGNDAAIDWSELTAEGKREQTVVRCNCCSAVAA